MAQQALFLRWALFATLIGVGLVSAMILGAFSAIAHYDPTFISFTIITLMVLATGWCGWLTWRLQNDLRSGFDDELGQIRNDASHGSLVVNVCTLLGFLGTIVGMMIMFFAASKGLASGIGGGQATFKAFMQTVLTGLWPAFITTAVGLVCGFLVLLQYHMLDHAVTRAELEAKGGTNAPS